jgi:hypothetical protein
MESIIISTKENVSKFTFVDNEWSIETLYKRDNKPNNFVVKKTMDLEEEKALNFFRFVTGKPNLTLDFGKEAPTETDETDKNIITLKPTKSVKPKAKPRARATKSKLKEIEDKVDVQ